jgi:CheY-like chemotaxis protein
MYLPRAATAAVPKAARPESDGQLPRGREGETILLVEDNEQVRRFAATTLNELGYTVLQANDARQALELVGARRRIDLLFSDVVLGNGMNGFELAAAARAQAPNLSVLFTSAYHQASAPETGSSNLLQKPYWEHELATAVRSAIGGA